MRMFGHGDADFLLELLNSPGFVRHIGDRKVRTSQEAKDYIDQRILRAFDNDHAGMWLVELKENGEAIGTCGLVDRDEVEGLDLGFAFLPAHYRKGYAFEASKKVIEELQKDEVVKEVAAIVNNDNIASISLLEKLGFSYQGVIRLNNNDRVNLMKMEL